jgi:hypothetical protein
LNLSLATVLVRVCENPGIKSDVVARTTYLGERDAEDATEELVNRSYLMLDPEGGLVATTEGKRVRAALGKRWEEFVAQQMAGLSEADRTGFDRVLTRIVERNTLYE